MSDPVTISMITTIGGVIIAGIGYLVVRLNRMDVKVDGRLTQLLEANTRADKAEGHAEGVSDEQARVKDVPD